MFYNGDKSIYCKKKKEIFIQIGMKIGISCKREGQAWSCQLCRKGKHAVIVQASSTKEPREWM